MFRYNFISALLLITALTSSVAFGDEGSDSAPEATPSIKTKAAPKRNFLTVGATYMSWGEVLKLDNAASAKTDKGHSSFLGNSLLAEMEHYFRPRWGYALQGSVLFGVAEVGGSQSVLTYHQNHVHWFGASGSPRLAYRLSKWIITSLGPVGLYRSMSLPADSTGTTAKSGVDFNLGATLDLRLRVSDNLEVRQEIGRLMTDADTIWALGLGYKF